MDFKEYRQRGKEMVDYIADYLENIRERRVFPDVKPGYMSSLIPDSAPVEGEDWDKIFSDVERAIMPGITHWQSPYMHAYFPALNSFPSLLGDMLADAINGIGFTWASSPACTELEIIVMNWLGKMIGLPDEFMRMHNNSKGGGVIQTTASEATLVCLLAGRTKAIQRYHEKHPGLQDAEVNARLVAYCSDQAHSSVEKAALIGLVRMRYIEADEFLSMRGEPLKEAIEDDIKKGLVPFWVCVTLGTTGSCSFDNLEEIGEICRRYNIWVHVDAAYAGSAFICPEFRIWLKGIERADSIAFNPSKWLLVHFDCTALWIKDSTALHRTFNVEPLYLQHENSGVAVDFMHWQIPLSRRFRSLKLWFVLRSFGIKGLQRHIREGVRLAQKFEVLVLADHRFQIPAKRYLGLVVFRIRGENAITERVLKRLNHRGMLHCVPASLKGKYVIRFTITSPHTTVDDIIKDWHEIRTVTTMVLQEMNEDGNPYKRVQLKDTKEKNEAFGSSLLLSNCPLSPKVVNGSFAAIFDTDEFLAKTYAGIRIAHQGSPNMRRRVRGILMSGKQFSLDSHMDVVVHGSMDNCTPNNSIDSDGKNNTNRKNKDHSPICEDSEDSVEEREKIRKQIYYCRQQNQRLLQQQKQQTNPQQYPMPNLAFLLLAPNQMPTMQMPAPQQQFYFNLLPQFQQPTMPTMDAWQYMQPLHPMANMQPMLTQMDNLRFQNKKKNVAETQTENKQRKNLDIKTEVYPGKRFLDSISTTYDESCSFTNTVFQLTSPSREDRSWVNKFAKTSMEKKIVPEKPERSHMRRIGRGGFYLPTLSSNSSNEIVNNNEDDNNIKQQTEEVETIAQKSMNSSTHGSLYLGSQESPEHALSDSECNINSSGSSMPMKSYSSAEDLLLQ